MHRPTQSHVKIPTLYLGMYDRGAHDVGTNFAKHVVDLSQVPIVQWLSILTRLYHKNSGRFPHAGGLIRKNIA